MAVEELAFLLANGVDRDVDAVADELVWLLHLCQVSAVGPGIEMKASTRACTSVSSA